MNDDAGGLLKRWFSRKPAPGALQGADVPTGPFHFQEDRVVGERYRTLAWMLEQLQSRQSFQVVAVTSSVEGEGKSTVSLNLAAVIADRRAGQVLLVDCDMRRPRLRALLDGGGEGLDSLLEGRCSFDQALCFNEELGLHFIPVHEPVDEPLKLLSDPSCLERLLGPARERFEYVILDTPPVLPVTDSLFLAEASDAVLFVVRAGETSGRMLARSLRILRREHLLGIVFNGAARPMAYGYGYGQYVQTGR